MKISIIAAAAGIGIGFVIGCQSYDFEPVQPLAIAQTTQTWSTIGRTLKPNMALLVDKSGSMNFAVNPMDPACDVGGGLPSLCGQTLQPACPAGCPTRWGDLRAAMSSFLTNSGTVARLGLALYPSPAGGCSPTSSISVQVSQSNDVDSELQATANQILSTINATGPGGGTPTGASVAYVADNALLADTQRDNFILLLTDGLPNCNANNPNNHNTNPAACRCTDANPASCQNAPTLLCLDKDATVAAIEAVKTNKNIKTIVVGFGAETASGDGPEVLEAMALAGGFPRSCSSGTNSECGTGTCNPTTKTCSPAFYQAANAADLAKVLENIAKRVSQAPCDYRLEVTPSQAEFITVVVNGEVIPRGADTWDYLLPGGDAGPNGTVKLLGSLCDRAKAATEENPVDIEIRLLKTF